MKDNFIENTFGGDYTLRFDGINFSIPKDGYKNLIVKASVLANPEIKGATYRYDFSFTNASLNAIRGKDGVGLDQYANRATASRVTVEATASTGTVTASLNSATPKLGFVLGNATATTSNKEILKTDFKAENKDVTIKGLDYTMTDGGSVVSAVKLYDGSTLLGSVAISGGKATFTNLNVSIAKDTTKTLTLSVDFIPIVIAKEGSMVKGALVHTDISGVDSSDNSIAKTAITVTGKEQRVYTKAPTFALVSTNIVKTTQAGSPDKADATIVLNVTANGGDIYIKKTANANEKFVVTGPTADADFQYTSTADISSIDADYYVIRSGETKSFTLTGVMSGAGAGAFFKMAVTTIS